MTHRITRRRFLKASAIAASALSFPAILPHKVIGANEKLQIAGIGAGGKGAVDVGYCAGESIVALCDVDEQNAAGTFAKFPMAKKYKDYREMLAREEKSIDAVTVSTPDHVHAPASILAMKMGKHCYCQKPLTHSVFEARRMAEVAREKKVATQMGNQGYAHPGTRRLVEVIRAGALGHVREVHVWTDRPIWPQGVSRPADLQPVPSTLAWDLWLGPAPERPYHPAYVPFKWRGWWDFGTGALGDMGCHNMGLAFFALELRDPVSVEAASSGINSETAPEWSIITYEFPARSSHGPVKLVWYDGHKKPPQNMVKGRGLPENGVIMVGEKDTLFVPSYWGGGGFLSGAKIEDFKSIPESLPRLPSATEDNDKAHHLEWIAACKGGPRGQSNFDHSGPMTEAVLLGNVALRAGKKIEWDAKSLKVTNVPDASKYIQREYRKGWEL